MGEMNEHGLQLREQEVDSQAARSLLRERFLRLISHLSGGQSCQMRLFDHSDHTCRVRGFNPSFDNIIVENLSTPYPEAIPKAIIRTSDVITMHFVVNSLEKYR